MLTAREWMEISQAHVVTINELRNTIATLTAELAEAKAVTCEHYSPERCGCLCDKNALTAEVERLQEEANILRWYAEGMMDVIQAACPDDVGCIDSAHSYEHFKDTGEMWSLDREWYEKEGGEA